MLDSDTIQPGDTFGLTIWESVKSSLLAAQNNNSTILEEVQVNARDIFSFPMPGGSKRLGIHLSRSASI